MDPYKTLGIKKNASKETIKKAFRKKALQHHPDRGGDKEEFAKCKKACDVLLDDERRKKYDETGVIDEKVPSPDTEFQASLEILFQFAKQIIDQLCNQNQPPEKYDLVELIRGAVQRNITDLDTNIYKKGNEIGRYMRLSGRFKNKKGEENYLDNFIATIIRQCKTQQENMKRAKDKLKEVLNVLKDYSFSMDEQVHQAQQLLGFGIVWRGTV